jgi:hypothetical protein
LSQACPTHSWDREIADLIRLIGFSLAVLRIVFKNNFQRTRSKPCAGFLGENRHQSLTEIAQIVKVFISETRRVIDKRNLFVLGA